MTEHLQHLSYVLMTEKRGDIMSRHLDPITVFGCLVLVVGLSAWCVQSRLQILQLREEREALRQTLTEFNQELNRTRMKAEAYQFIAEDVKSKLEQLSPRSR